MQVIGRSLRHEARIERPVSVQTTTKKEGSAVMLLSSFEFDATPPILLRHC